MNDAVRYGGTVVLEMDEVDGGGTAVSSSEKAPEDVGEKGKSKVGENQRESHAHPRPTTSAHPRVGMGNDAGGHEKKSAKIGRDDLETDRGWIEWVKKRNKYYPRRRHWEGRPGNWRKSTPVYITSKLGSKSEDEYAEHKAKRKAARDIRKQNSKS